MQVCCLCFRTVDHWHRMRFIESSACYCPKYLISSGFFIVLLKCTKSAIAVVVTVTVAAGAYQFRVSTSRQPYQIERSAKGSGNQLSRRRKIANYRCRDSEWFKAHLRSNIFGSSALEGCTSLGLVIFFIPAEEKNSDRQEFLLTSRFFGFRTSYFHCACILIRSQFVSFQSSISTLQFYVL